MEDDGDDWQDKETRPRRAFVPSTARIDTMGRSASSCSAGSGWRWPPPCPPRIGGGAEAVAGIWLLACVWAALAGFACAHRGGVFRRGDWSAFRNATSRPDDRGDALDWSTRTGEYSYLRIGEEHDRLMSGD